MRRGNDQSAIAWPGALDGADRSREQQEQPGDEPGAAAWSMVGIVATSHEAFVLPATHAVVTRSSRGRSATW
jgi:hypothetical protein